MDPIWVVIADSARARIFRADGPLGALEELDNLLHSESRMHGRELETDGPGRAFDSGGQGRHAMEKERRVKDQEALHFAQELRDYLEKARAENRFERLTVAAAPAFLGMLRDRFGDALKRQVAVEIDKNLTQHRPDEIRALLPERL